MRSLPAMVVLGGCLLLPTLLAGCGFHLRQAPNLPPSMRHIYVAAPGQNGDLLRELRRSLASDNTEVMTTPEGATTTLSIISVIHDSRALAVNRRGQALEYQVSYEVEFSLLVQGAVILEPQTVTLTRNYAYSVSNAVGNEEQEQALEQAMAKDVSQFISFRMVAAAKSLPPGLATVAAPAAATRPEPAAATLHVPVAASTPPPA
jgi:LPS-assembly lipoprotein